ncbi:hypothetical protein BDP27DRAFT_567186 [Rhodocollybia butyracea]|uniref:Uncharacterized protein n=1 Tax=Rhodocollybia butyracea TaxID=206335 RepID=A0A9P5PZC6_9AGAR|nr:hypothetical protein BDP27DRAFT_567186 [Rhodocollybia butyracea]
MRFGKNHWEYTEIVLENIFSNSQTKPPSSLPSTPHRHAKDDSLSTPTGTSPRPSSPPAVSEAQGDDVITQLGEEAMDIDSEEETPAPQSMVTVVDAVGEPLIQALLISARRRQAMIDQKREEKYSPYLWIEGLGRRVMSDFLPWFTREVPELRVTVLFKIRNGNAEPVWLVKFVNRDQAQSFATGYTGTLNDGDTFWVTRAAHSDYVTLIKRPSLLIENWRNGKILNQANRPPALMERTHINFVERLTEPPQGSSDVARIPQNNATLDVGGMRKRKRRGGKRLATARSYMGDAA